MQTFLPYVSFIDSARCLDRQRLGKQRVEAKQILQAIQYGPGAGWYNHPACRMWRGHESALALYGAAVCKEWIGRGYKDNLFPFFLERIQENVILPPWLGQDTFHASHQSNLLRKLPTHYARFCWDVPNDLPYVWPVP